MDVLAPVKAVGWAAGVFGQEKSFVANPIIGSPRLNRWGLHRARVALADRAATLRRRMLASAVAPEDREEFAANGFVTKERYLPDEVFAKLREELLSAPLPAREMRQGQTVTRVVPLTERLKPRLPLATSVARDSYLRKLTGYVAGRSGEPVHFIQTVVAEPATGDADPQTALHADTFHATAKFWLFLHDVGPEDGPFIYAPGSHVLTPERLDWEYEQSLTAREERRRHHSYGSFRISWDDAMALGYAKPRQMVVKANTLVVADTYGFHSRSPSDHPTIRYEIHGHLRRNPFTPWNGLDPQSLPGIKGRQLDLYHGWLDWKSRRSGVPHLWKDVGEVMVDSGAHI